MTSKRTRSPTLKQPPGGLQQPLDGTLLPRTRVGRLDAVEHWRREVGRIYRAMRRGDMPPDLGTKLTFVAQVGAKLTEIEEELRQAKRIAEALEQHHNPLAQLEGPAPDADQATPVEVLPAESSEVQP